MKIDNEFAVSVPADRAWQVLTDLEYLAPCLPGAQLTGVEDEVYRGKVRVKVGPVVSQFTGTARFLDKDDDARHAVISAAGKDARGAGNASATIDLRLTPDGARTVVTVSTNVNITGKLAQFGSGMIKEISAKLLTQFVDNLERQLHPADATSEAAAEPVPAAVAEPVPVPVPETVAESAPEPAPEPVPEPVAEPVAVTVPASAAPSATAPSAAAPSATAPSAAVPAPAAPSAGPAGPDPVHSRPAFPAGASAGVGAAHPAPGADGGVRPVRTVAAPVTPDGEPEALDLMGLAGSSVYKRLIPVAAVVVVVVAALVYLIVR